MLVYVYVMYLPDAHIHGYDHVYRLFGSARTKRTVARALGLCRRPVMGF